MGVPHVPRLGQTRSSRIPALPWEKCYAKSMPDGADGLTVFDHCVDVGMVARALVQVLPATVRGLLGANPGGAAACHDVGKVSPGYQLKYFREKLRERLPELAAHALANYETRHALIGELAINASLGTEHSAPGLAAGAHHGVRDDKGFRHDDAVLGGPAWADERLRLASRLAAECGALAADPNADSHVLAGLVCVADWIGSDERFFDPGAKRARAESEAIAGRAIAECGWRPVKFRPSLSFADIFGWEPYPLQLDLIDAVQEPGLYVFEAPMGSGKTEAALYAAYRLITSGANAGFYFGLPTRLTSDKIHERVSAFLSRVAVGETTVRLAHGNAWLREYENGGERLGPGEEWFNPSKRALLMPFAVGTIDQALMSVIKVRHFFVRSFGLAGKVVILDEVHSYDVYTGTLLDVLVRRLLDMRCTVIVLSATLTGARRAKLLGDPQQVAPTTDYPLITVETPSGACTRAGKAPPSTQVGIHLADLTDGDVAEHATQHAAAGECVLCIANTVARAQTWLNQVKAAMVEGTFEVGLLHSRFPAWRRSELEDVWTYALGKEGPRPHGCVLVATQVVEQSVDLDADFMISELAPTDMLLQRLGRMWRHRRAERPCPRASLLVVTRNLDEASSYDDLITRLGKSNARVYAPYVLWRSYQAWKRTRRLSLPDGIRGLLEATYAEPQGNCSAFVEEARNLLAKRAAKLRDLAIAARADAYGFPTMRDDERAVTRYSDYPTVNALIARSVTSAGSAATLVLSNGKRIKVDDTRRIPPYLAETHRNLVSLPRYRLPHVTTPAFLSRYFFDTTPVLLVDDAGGLCLEGRPTGMRYDDERGLQMTDPVPAWLSSRRSASDDGGGEGVPDELDW